MPATALRSATVFLIFFSTCAAAQERKPTKPLSSVPCQKRNYRLELFYDGFFDTPGLTPPQKPEMIGGRGELDGRNYRTQGGQWVSVERVEFRSSENAHDGFEAVVASAVHILQRGPAIGRESSVTETNERVLFDSSKEKKPSFEIIWQSNKYLWFLRSSSLREVKDFEEKMEFDCN